MRRTMEVMECRVADEYGWSVVVVIAAHLTMAFLFGLMRGCGVFYLSWKTEFEASAKETAAVQSLITAVSCFGGGVLTKRHGCRISAIIGGIATSLAMFCSVWASSIFHLYIAATISGAGLGMAFNAGLVAVAMYFKRKYKVAHGVAFSGIGTGIMALPPVFQKLLDSYGWRGSILVISAVMANVVVCGALFRPRRPECRFFKDTRTRLRTSHEMNKQVGVQVDVLTGDREGEVDRDPMDDDPKDVELQVDCIMQLNTDRQAVSTSIKKSPVIKLMTRVSSELGLNIFLQSYRFSLLCLTLFQFSGPYAAFAVFIVPRARSTDGSLNGAGVVTPSRAAFLISAIGIGNLVGQLGNGLLISWKISAVNVGAGCLFLSGVSSLLINVDEYAVWVAASILQGFSTGAFYAITVVLTRRFVGIKSFAICTGLSHIFMGVGMLSGPILAGWLFDGTSSYKSVYYMLAGIYFISALQMLLVPLLKRLEPGMDIRHSDK